MYKKDKQRALFQLSKELLKLDTQYSKAEAEQQVVQLGEVIKYHEWRYYVLNDPVVSDFEYDSLFKMLEAREAAHKELILPDSPTQRVSNDLTTDFPSVAHLIPMLSLENSYNAEDLKDFDRRVKDKGDLDENMDIEYCAEPKFDGGSIALVYENDMLIRAATRGNGTMGEEITNNARAMRTIPLKAEFSKYGIYKVELRGEALIRVSNFDKINKKREKDGESVFANPRNAATGAMRMKDPNEVAARGLEAFLYQLGYAVDKDGNDILGNFKTHNEGIQMLEDLGFKVPIEERKVCKNIEDISEFVKNWEAKRDSYDYEIDGMVVKVNKLSIQEKLGYTSHHPRWAIAYKFKAKQATTKLIDVHYQVGKIGAITPVAKLEPVKLAGVMVSSVSLHNEEFIKGKDLRLGDTVLVERAGDVIPYIVKSMDELRDGTEKVIDFPTSCPSCGTALTKPETEAVWRCDNGACEAQIVQRMIHHVSKDAMDIDGFGESYVRKFYDLGWLNSLADIYRLPYHKIQSLEGFGTRSVEKLRKAVEEAKGNPVSRLLYSLSIHYLGRSVSKKLSAELDRAQDLATWEEEQYTDLHDIGPKVAATCMAFFKKPENVALIDELESLGVNTTVLDSEKKKKGPATGPLAGKTILFTGKLLQLTRDGAKEAAEGLGATLSSGVSSKLNILVVGEKAGSKLKKAEAIGTVEILTEQQFMDIMNQQPASTVSPPVPPQDKNDKKDDAQTSLF